MEYNFEMGLYIVKKNGKPIGISIHTPASKGLVRYRKDVE